MTTIALEGMEFFAYHGFYEEEHMMGGNYIVDVYIRLQKGEAGATDELADTINYETVYFIVKTEMKKPAQLLENLTARIVNGLKYQFNFMAGLRVRVKKMNPPLQGIVKNAFVEEDHSYLLQCARCKKEFVCYGTGACWCGSGISLSPETQETLKHQYEGRCLCRECLTYYAT